MRDYNPSEYSILNSPYSPLLTINAFDDPIIDGSEWSKPYHPHPLNALAVMFNELSVLISIEQMSSHYLGCTLADVFLAALPIEEIANSPYACMAVTGGGGHIGWFTGYRAEERWCVRPAMEWLGAATRDLPVAAASITTYKSSSAGMGAVQYGQGSADRAESGSGTGSGTGSGSGEAEEGGDGDGDGEEGWERVSRPSVDIPRNNLSFTETQPETQPTAATTTTTTTTTTAAASWEWVLVPAHAISGVGGDGRIGWRVLDKGEIVTGGEGSGTLQGL